MRCHTLMPSSALTQGISMRILLWLRLIRRWDAKRMPGVNDFCASRLRGKGRLQMRVCSLMCMLCLLAVTAWPQTTRQPADCSECHEAQAMKQPATQMGQAMQLSGNNQTLKLHPKLTFRRGVYSYAVETRNTKTLYTVSDGSRSITVPVIWSMGAQAQTWVLEYDGHMYESMVSYYPSINGLDVTVGD